MRHVLLWLAIETQMPNNAMEYVRQIAQYEAERKALAVWGPNARVVSVTVLEIERYANGHGRARAEAMVEGA